MFLNSTLNKFSLVFLILFSSVFLYFSLKSKDRFIGIKGEVSSHKYPKEGDNLKVAKAYRVYKLENGKLRRYKDHYSYLCGGENPEFGTLYDQGGILITDSSIVYSYPIGEDMPSLQCKLQDDIQYYDKLFHAIAYFIFFILIFTNIRKYSNIKFRNNLLISFFVGMSFGVLVEILQKELAVGRNIELLDILANLIGICIAIILIVKKKG